jgi:hypothetical protein
MIPPAFENSWKKCRSVQSERNVVVDKKDIDVVATLKILEKHEIFAGAS